MPKKRPKRAEREHMARVANMGCIACYNLGYDDTPAEIHHITTGVGMGQRASNYQVLPLCPMHHRQGGPGIAIHAGKQSWELRHGREIDLLEQVREML